MDERIIILEKRMAFLERHIEELNEALIEQQKKIQTLTDQLKIFKTQVTSGDLVKPAEDETPPPHY